MVLESVLLSIDRGFIKNVNPKIIISTVPPPVNLKTTSEKLGIAIHVISNSINNSNRLEYDEKIIKILQENMVVPNTGLICLIGYRRILTPFFVKRYWMRIMNVHPSLLPSFPGLFAHRQAIEHAVKVTGITIHFVNEKIDEGPIIAQSCVSLIDEDTEESLLLKLLEKACDLYPLCINLFSEEKLRICGRKVLIYK